MCKYRVESVGGIDGVRIYDESFNISEHKIRFLDATCYVVDETEMVSMGVIELARHYSSGGDMSLYQKNYETKFDLFVDIQKGLKLIELNDRVFRIRNDCDVLYSLCYEDNILREIHIEQYLYCNHTIQNEPIKILIQEDFENVKTCMDQYNSFNVRKYFEEILKHKCINEDSGFWISDILFDD